MKLLLILMILFLVYTSFILAQDMPDDMLKEHQEMEQTMQEEEEGFLEELREHSPEAYNHHIQMRQKQENIKAIAQAFSSRQLSEKDARDQIRSMIEADINIEHRAEHIDEEIESTRMHISQLENELRRLYAIKDNPYIIMEEQIDSHLGISREYY